MKHETAVCSTPLIHLTANLQLPENIRKRSRALTAADRRTAAHTLIQQTATISADNAAAAFDALVVHTGTGVVLPAPTGRWNPTGTWGSPTCKSNNKITGHIPAT